ncbi:hypothetical protein WJX72_004482 [[Myrmecia] bisecta]|uniref:ubiquitinyl hydrolase 1 n=1 Tax=[Myrmecia] bisecta TaxID=41462 RepID=A0AAW1PY97_9CHLO
MFSKHLVKGRQEDAHEFLRCLLDAVERAVLVGRHDSKPAGVVQAPETEISYLFGGMLQSQVKCKSCGGESNTYDPFHDLSLELGTCKSVDQALQLFTAPEHLSGENAYSCERCKRKTDACKRMTVHEDECSSATQRPSPDYSLSGVLVHDGFSAHAGHYYTCVRAPDGHWFEMNDTRVSPMRLLAVLAEEAYLLFYVRSAARPPKQYQNVPELAGGQPVSPSLKRTLPEGGWGDAVAPAKYSKSCDSDESVSTQGPPPGSPAREWHSPPGRDYPPEAAEHIFSAISSSRWRAELKAAVAEQRDSNGGQPLDDRAKQAILAKMRTRLPHDIKSDGVAVLEKELLTHSRLLNMRK